MQIGEPTVQIGEPTVQIGERTVQIGERTVQVLTKAGLSDWSQIVSFMVK